MKRALLFVVCSEMNWKTWWKFASIVKWKSCAKWVELFVLSPFVDFHGNLTKRKLLNGSFLAPLHFVLFSSIKNTFWYKKAKNLEAIQIIQLYLAWRDLRTNIYIKAKKHDKKNPETIYSIRKGKKNLFRLNWFGMKK